MKKKTKEFKIKIPKLKISSNTISYIALFVTVVSTYYQFFHINHEVKYSSLYPLLDEDSKTITFPILFKNTGNQTETILDFQLLLEARNNNRIFYKRISELKSEEFFSILKPGESKKINLTGNYEVYLFGTIFTETDDFNYKPISDLENLTLLLKTTYLNTEGVVASEERIVGSLTFTKNETIKQIDCPPTELIDLDLDKDDFEIHQYTIIPDNKQYNGLHVDFTDSISIKENLDKLLFLERVLKSDKKENKETLEILNEVLKPYRKNTLPNNGYE